jgi:hypothetical protein
MYTGNNRGARRFSPRADCNVLLRAWEGAFAHAYLANWPRMEGRLMPAVSVAPPDTCSQSGFSEYFPACTRAPRALARNPPFPPPPFFWTREEPPRLRLVTPNYCRRAPRALARNLLFSPPFLDSFGFFGIIKKKKRRRKKDVFWSWVQFNPMVSVAPLKWSQSG